MTTDLTAALHPYGLTACGPLRPLSEGSVGESAVAETNCGPVVVKRCSTRFDDARLHVAAAAHQHVAAVGLAPRLFRTLDGAPIAYCDGARFTVTEFTSPTIRPDLVSFAEALAALHRRLDTFAPARPHAADFLELPDPPDAELHRLRAQPDQAANAAHIDRRLRLLRTVGLRSSDIAGLTRPWVHGDAHPGNLLATTDPPRSMFIDFDQVSRFPRSYELLRAFFAQLGEDPDPAAVARDLREFTAAYQEQAPLPTAEHAIMIDFFLTVQAAETRTFTTTAREVRGMSAYAQARHRRLAWLAQHHGTLRRALGKDHQ